MAKTGKKQSTSKPAGTSAPRKRRVQFAYEAPEAKEVLVSGSFSGWQESYKMKKDRSGFWKTIIQLEPGRYEYRFLVDGEWRNDPRSSHRISNEFGSENDVIEVAAGGR